MAKTFLNRNLPPLPTNYDRSQNYTVSVYHQKEGDTVSRQTSDRDIFFDQMPDTFTTEFAKEYGKAIGTTVRSIHTWIADFVKHGKLRRINKCVYMKTFLVKEIINFNGSL
ncbi:MAG: hypothetical protein MJZ31_11810 [Bacteroidales bacterium]|nr:hypothetical protein [Bacteroidales bacterium]